MSFERMADIIPEKHGNRFAIVHFRFTEEVVEQEKQKYRCEGKSDEIEGLVPGTYVKLVDKTERKIVMSDTWMEQNTNSHVVNRARGKMLIGGLGIGLLVVPLWRKPEVTEITVVEKSSEVIDLVLPHLRKYFIDQGGDPDKLRVYTGDIFEYTPDKGEHFDVIYFDIWNEVSEKNREDVDDLKNKFTPYLAAGGWISAWREKDIQD